MMVLPSIADVLLLFQGGPRKKYINAGIVVILQSNFESSLEGIRSLQRTNCALWSVKSGDSELKQHWFRVLGAPCAVYPPKPLRRSSRQQRCRGPPRTGQCCQRSPLKGIQGGIPDEMAVCLKFRSSGASRKPVNPFIQSYSERNTRMRETENGEHAGALMSGGGGPRGIPSSLASLPPVSSPPPAVVHGKRR
jgi:hypothetical protein